MKIAKKEILVKGKEKGSCFLGVKSLEIGEFRQ